MTSIPVSVIVLTKNECRGIAETLSRLRKFDEVIVVDSESEDTTVALAEAAGARVVSFHWDGRYPKKKQWALNNADPRHDWVLLLDADEYPSTQLTSEIAAIFADRSASLNDIGAFDIHLRYRFAGKFLRHGHRVTKRSLLNRKRSHFPEPGDLDAPGIREVEGHYQPQTLNEIRTLTRPLLHDDRDPVSSWFDRHNRYSDWEAHLRSNPVLRSKIASQRTRQGAIFDRIPFKPLIFFTYGYIARLGFLDGQAGFDYHLALAMYYWQIGVKVRESKAA